MAIRRTALTVVLTFHCAPALAFDYTQTTPHPRALTAFAVGERQVEMLAVTRRARADTAIRRAHLDECKTMAKIMPGYPQPAIVSVDFRIKF